MRAAPQNYGTTISSMTDERPDVCFATRQGPQVNELWGVKD